MRDPVQLLTAKNPSARPPLPSGIPRCTAGGVPRQPPVLRPDPPMGGGRAAPPPPPHPPARPLRPVTRAPPLLSRGGLLEVHSRRGPRQAPVLKPGPPPGYGGTS